MRGVAAAHVQSGIGFGIAQGLRFFQHLGERRAQRFHLGEDIIAGAVEDALHRLHVIGDQAFPQGLHDGNAARHRSFEFELEIALLRPFGQRLAMNGQQRLVGRHHMLAMIERGFDQLPGDAILAADQFDNHVGVAFDQRQRIGDEIRDLEISRLCLIARAHAHHHKIAPRARLEVGRLRRQRLDHAAAHRAQARNGDFEWFPHRRGLLRRRQIGGRVIGCPWREISSHCAPPGGCDVHSPPAPRAHNLRHIRQSRCPGETATLACLRSCLANSIEPASRNFSGKGAQANIEASGAGMSQPAWAMLFTSTSRRDL